MITVEQVVILVIVGVLALAAAEGLGEYRASKCLWTPQTPAGTKPEPEPLPRGTITARRLAKRMARKAIIVPINPEDLLTGPIILPPLPEFPKPIDQEKE